MNKFAFIIHPIEIEDFHKAMPILKNIPTFLISTMGKYINPIKISEIKGVDTPEEKIKGYLIGVPFTLRQMEELPIDYILNKYIKAGELAKKLGVNIIGLEPSSSKIAEHIDTIAQRLSISITTGRIFSLLSVLCGIKMAAESLGKDFKECDLSIIGIDNRKGEVLAKLIAREIKYLTLVSTNKSNLESIKQDILVETGTAVHITENLGKVIKNGDIIVITSNQEYKNINIEEVKNNAIICDLSRPRIITKEIEDRRHDILFIDDGLIKLPFKIDLGFDFGYSTNMYSPALAETILFTMEEKLTSYSGGGTINMDMINTINDIAKSNGLTVGGVTNFYREIQFKT